MQIVCAPGSFKGSLTAYQVAQAMAEGAKRVFAEAALRLVPMADGGEGTAQALLDATGGEWREITVEDPLGRPVSAAFGLLGDCRTAVLEMAAASGLTLISNEQLNPLAASTFGTGQLIRAALDAGARRILIGIGGSATNDGGAGMAEALGYRLLQADGRQLPRGGGALAQLSRIETAAVDARLAGTEFIVACDVSNPLLGPNGASKVYGPQKGATPEMIEKLDASLANFAKVLERTFGWPVAEMPGAGAAGGMGAGLAAFCGARLTSGVEMVAEAVCLREHLRLADLVLTGEGRLDDQTAQGKTPYGVAKAAKEFDLPVLAVTGGIETDCETLHSIGIDAVTSIEPGPLSLAEAMAQAFGLIADATERLLRAYKTGLRQGWGGTSA